MRENLFKDALLNPSVFPVTWELVPGRGARETAQEKALALAKQASIGGKICALTLTDNPGGTPAMRMTGSPSWATHAPRMQRSSPGVTYLMMNL